MEYYSILKKEKRGVEDPSEGEVHKQHLILEAHISGHGRVVHDWESRQDNPPGVTSSNSYLIGKP